MFKVRDKVKCIDSNGSYEQLECGVVYTVSFHALSPEFIILSEIASHVWSVDRFVLTTKETCFELCEAIE